MTETAGGLGPHLDDEALSAAVDNEATEAELAHLSSCPRCRARFGQLGAVADAVGAPVLPRAAGEVSGVIARATASWGPTEAGGDQDRSAESSGRAVRDRQVPVVGTGSSGRAVRDRQVPLGAGFGTYGGARSGRPARRPTQARSVGAAGAAVAVAAAVVVVFGLLTATRGGHTGASTTAGQPNQRSAAGPVSNTSVAPGAVASTVDGGNLGDQSDTAAVAAALRSRLANPVSAQGASGPAPSSLSSPATTICVVQARAAVGLGPDISIVPRLVGSLRWQGQPAVVVVYSTPQALTGVIMRSADCGRLAVFGL